MVPKRLEGPRVWSKGKKSSPPQGRRKTGVDAGRPMAKVYLRKEKYPRKAGL